MNSGKEKAKRSSLAVWIAGYGLFLIVIGLLGWLSNPAQAKTALISGSVFGSINLLFALFLAKGLLMMRWVTLAVAGVLSMIFVWRSTVSWIAVSNGEPKWVAALLISAMLGASMALIFRLLTEPD